MIAVTLLVLIGGMMQTSATNPGEVQRNGTGVGAVLMFVVPILLAVRSWAQSCFAVKDLGAAPSVSE